MWPATPVSAAGFVPEASASSAASSPASNRKPTLVMVSIRTVPPARSASTWRSIDTTRVIALSPTTWPSQHSSMRSSRDSTRPGASPSATSTRITRGSTILVRSPAAMRREGGSICNGPSSKGSARERSLAPECSPLHTL